MTSGPQTRSACRAPRRRDHPDEGDPIHGDHVRGSERGPECPVGLRLDDAVDVQKWTRVAEPVARSQELVDRRVV